MRLIREIDVQQMMRRGDVGKGKRGNTMEGGKDWTTQICLSLPFSVLFPTSPISPWPRLITGFLESMFFKSFSTSHFVWTTSQVWALGACGSSHTKWDVGTNLENSRFENIRCWSRLKFTKRSHKIHLILIEAELFYFVHTRVDVVQNLFAFVSYRSLLRRTPKVTTTSSQRFTREWARKYDTTLPGWINGSDRS